MLVQIQPEPLTLFFAVCTQLHFFIVHSINSFIKQVNDTNGIAWCIENTLSHPIIGVWHIKIGQIHDCDIASNQLQTN